MIPSPGRIVEYTLSADDARQINKRRDDAKQEFAAQQNSGFMVHYGNAVSEGESYPMVIIRVWGTDENSAVNGKVLLDGNDDFWATSRVQGEGPYRWREFARV
jgi:hypothetical protein